MDRVRVEAWRRQGEPGLRDSHRGRRGAACHERPDGRWLAFLRQRIPGFDGDAARLTLLDLAIGSTRTLAAAWDRSISSYAWSRDGRAIFSPVNDAGRRRVYRLDVADRAPPRALTTSSSFSGVAVAKDSLVALRQGFSEAATLVRIDLRSGAVAQLSEFDDAALGRLDFGRVESVAYAGARGFGQAFADSINPDRISMPYQDTLRAAEWFRRQSWIDPDRLVAGGAGFGGFLAATLPGRERPFKALVAHAAVYDEFTQYGADHGAQQPRFFSFWERPEEFARYSPHASAGHFRTPTLVSHGQLDPRVPVNQGIELFNALQKLGVPSRLVYFPDENHGILKPQNSMFWYHTVQDWLARYAAPGPR